MDPTYTDKPSFQGNDKYWYKVQEADDLFKFIIQIRSSPNTLQGVHDNTRLYYKKVHQVVCLTADALNLCYLIQTHKSLTHSVVSGKGTESMME